MTIVLVCVRFIVGIVIWFGLIIVLLIVVVAVGECFVKLIKIVLFVAVGWCVIVGCWFVSDCHFHQSSLISSDSITFISNPSPYSWLNSSPPIYYSPSFNTIVLFLLFIVIYILLRLSTIFTIGKVFISGATFRLATFCWLIVIASIFTISCSLFWEMIVAYLMRLFIIVINVHAFFVVGATFSILY